MSKRNKVIVWVSIIGVLLTVGVVNAIVNPSSGGSVPSPVPLATPLISR